MEDFIKTELELEEMSDWHKALLKHCKNLTDMSRKKMKEKYGTWRTANDTYRGLRPADRDDVKANERGEPVKMVVPLTFAQVQTFVAFCLTLYTQRERMFELVGVEENDHKAAKIGEALLQRDLVKNCYEQKLYQLLLDVARFGIGIMKTSWREEVSMTSVEKEGVMSETGIMGMPMMEEQRTVTSQGNVIDNISPFRFYPDVRLPLSRFQEGEFVSSEEVQTMVTLRQLEREGEVAGLKWVEPYAKNKLIFETLERQMEPENEGSMLADAMTESEDTEGTVVVTECQVKLVPSKFKINGEPMGPETYPVPWIVWYVNGERVIKAEPMDMKHNKFSYAIAEFTPDVHCLLNDGLAETIDNLQNVITWLINSHITSVRKTIQNWLVGDPTAIEMSDITERRPFIRLKPEYALQGVDKFIKQLDVRDVTGTHMADSQALQSLVQIVSGINDNALGQFHTGRRSATEARNVNSATASRLKMHALLIFRMCLEQLARQMLANHQQYLTAETYIKVAGANADPAAFTNFIKVTQDDLVGDYDFEVFDGTLPSERYERAAALEEFLVTMMKSPQMTPVIGFDPVRLVKEWMELRGIRNPERFLMDAYRQQELASQVNAMYGPQQNIGNEPNAPGAGEIVDSGMSTGAAGVPPQSSPVV